MKSSRFSVPRYGRISAYEYAWMALLMSLLMTTMGPSFPSPVMVHAFAPMTQVTTSTGVGTNVINHRGRMEHHPSSPSTAAATIFHDTQSKHRTSHFQSTPTTLRSAHESIGVFETILQSPTVWSSLIMVSIVALLYSWEMTIQNLRKTLPTTLMPVLDSILGEIGGLGFIGLLLGTLVVNGPFGMIVEQISEEFLGNGEILLETFEFLHDTFFEVGVAFFCVAGLTVFLVLKKLASLLEFRKAVLDKNQDGVVELAELAAFLNVPSVPVDLDGDGVLTEDEIRQAVRTVPPPSLWDELRMTDTQIKAEALVVRERLIRSAKVPADFRIDLYFSKIFGEKLAEIVELSPLTWLPLIPALAVANSIDVSRDVVSAASHNAFASSGYFLGTPENFAVCTFAAFVGWTWGWWNFWKLNSIMQMLTPILVKDSQSSCEVQLLPPKYEDDDLLRNFDSSPGIFGWIESQFGEPATNDQERLFGKAGAAGPELYIKSIKFQIWLVISQIVLWGTQIVARDISALTQHADNVGNPDLLVPELMVFGFYVLVSAGQLVLAPQTFLKYCLVTSIEQLARDEILEELREECEETKAAEAQSQADADNPAILT